MTMYASGNPKSKKALKEAIKEGKKVSVFSAGIGEPPTNGTAYLSGPHYPAPHSWYAEVTIEDGLIVKVK